MPDPTKKKRIRFKRRAETVRMMEGMARLREERAAATVAGGSIRRPGFPAIVESTATSQPASPEELAQLRSQLSDETIRARLGLGPESNLSEILQHPGILRQLAPAAPARATQLQEEELPLWRRMLAGGVKGGVVGLTAMPGVGNVIQAGRALTEPQNLIGVQGRPDASTLDVLDKALGEPLDLISETTIETAEAAFALSAGRDAEVPTAFKYGLGREQIRTGAHEAVEQFRDRSLIEEIVLGTVDPFMVFGAGKTGAKLGIALLKAGGRRSTRRGRALIKGDAIARELARDARIAEVSNAVGVPSYPTRSELLAQIQPRTTVGGRITGIPRRLADPSSEIPKMVPDSEERLVAEAGYLWRRRQEMAEGFIATIMAQVSAKGDVLDLFGISAKVQASGPRALKIMTKTDGSVIDDAQLYGNIFEHPNDWVLTPKQRDWIEYAHEITQDALKLAQSHGVNVKELGELDDAFFWFPRRVLDTSSGKRKIELVNGRGPSTSLTKHRYLDEMSEEVLARGMNYDLPTGALRSYLRSVYRAIALKELERDVDQLIHVKEVPPAAGKRAEDARNRVKRMEQTAHDAHLMIRGFVPSGQTRAAWKRRFPDLAGRMDAVFSLSPADLNVIVGKVSRQTLGAARVTPERLKAALREVLDAGEKSLPYDPQYEESMVNKIIRESKEAARNKVTGGLRVEGKDAILGLISKEIREGKLDSSHGTAVRRFIGLIPDSTLRTLSFQYVDKLSAPHLAGEYFPKQKLIQIVSNAVKDAEPARTIIHEISHHLMNYVPESELKKLHNYAKIQVKGLRTSAEGKELAERYTHINYRTTNFYEWFADSIADRGLYHTTKQLKDEFPKLTLFFDHVAQILQALYTPIKDLLTSRGLQSQLGDVYDKLMSGKYGENTEREFFDIPGISRRESLGSPGTPPTPARGRRLQSKDYTPDAIHSALTLLGKKGAAAEKLARETALHAEGLVKGAREAEVHALTDRMKDYLDIARTDRLEAVQESARVRASALSRDVTEGIAPSVSPSLIFDKEVAARLEKVIADAGLPVLKKVSDFNGAVRNLRTVFDMGALFVQGLHMFFNDPKTWGKSTALYAEAIVSPQIRGKYVAENAQDIVEMIRYGGVLGSSDYIESLQKGGWLAALPTLVEESPNIPQGLKPVLGILPKVIHITSERFSNGFETYLDVARIETWKGLRPMAKSDKELQELAAFVNEYTGVMSSKALGVPLSQRQFESAIPFFAPRYLRAMTSLYMDTLRGGLRGKYARRAISRFMIGAVMLHVAGAHALGQEPQLDPTDSSKFLKWDIAGQRVGLGGKGISFIKLFANVVETSYKNPEGFLSHDLMDPQTYKDNPGLGWIRNQLSPTASQGVNILTGSDPMGHSIPGLSDPVDLAKYVGQQTLPFWVDSAREAGEAAKASRTQAMGTAAAAEFFGWSSFPIPTYDRLKSLQGDYAKADYGKSLEDLERTRPFRAAEEKREMMARHEDLRQLQLTLDEEQRNRVLSRKGMAVKDRLVEIDVNWVNETNQAVYNYDNLIHKEQTPTKWREAWRQNAAVRKDAIKQIQKDNPELFRKIQESMADRTEEHPEYAARQEYFDALTTLTTDGGVIDANTGEIDYPILSQTKARIEEEWGPGMISVIEEELQAGRLDLYDINGEPVKLNERALEYMRSFDTLRPYWEAYKTALPQEDWDEFRLYDTAPETIKRQLRRESETKFARMNALVRTERNRLQRGDADIDEDLFLFYGRAPRSREFIKHIAEVIRAERGR